MCLREKADKVKSYILLCKSLNERIWLCLDQESVVIHQRSLDRKLNKLVFAIYDVGREKVIRTLTDFLQRDVEDKGYPSIKLVVASFELVLHHIREDLFELSLVFGDCVGVCFSDVFQVLERNILDLCE